MHPLQNFGVLSENRGVLKRKQENSHVQKVDIQINGQQKFFLLLTLPLSKKLATPLCMCLFKSLCVGLLTDLS